MELDAYEDQGYRSSEDEDFDPTREPDAGELEEDLDASGMGRREGIVSNRRTSVRAGTIERTSDANEGPKPSRGEKEELEEKMKIDAIWEQLNPRSKPSNRPKESVSVLPPANKIRTLSPSQPPISDAKPTALEKGEEKSDARAAARAALQALKQQEVGLAPGQVHETEIRRFAGQSIKLQKAVDEDVEKSGRKRKGSNLDSVLEQLGAGKKITVVDKSRYDWEGYKKDHKLEEELTTYKKSSNKYLDKVHFLKEAEMKEYERERDLKLKSDVRNRGRL